LREGIGAPDNNTNGLRGNERIVRKTVSCDSAEGWVGALPGSGPIERLKQSRKHN